MCVKTTVNLPAICEQRTSESLVFVQYMYTASAKARCLRKDTRTSPKLNLQTPVSGTELK